LDDVRSKYQQDLKLKEEESRIRLDALARQRANLERSIGELTDQARLAAERIPAMEQLYAQGLVIRQQVLDVRQAVITLNAAAADRAAQLKQLDAQVFEVQTQIPVMNASMRLDIARRARQIAEAESDLRLQERVTAPYAGVVVELKVVPGGTVAASTPVVSIQPDSDAIEVLAYVSAFQAKDVRAGMETRIFPSTVKREEYGFMRGRVVFVAEYPATAAAVMRNIQNEQLVQTLTGLGPISEVRVALERDATTVSGFRWSSPDGPPIRISEGTIVTAEIVTQTRAPITLVVPILRKTLGL
jgi:HlyD family secretion protein